jgi:uncharacterized protein YidB (DUF937 family)
MADIGSIVGSIVGSVLSGKEADQNHDGLSEVVSRLEAEGAGNKAGLLQLVLSAIKENGGLNSVIQQLRARGMGTEADSWIGTGSNAVADLQKLINLLNSPIVASIASKLGLDTGKASSAIASILPEVIDKLTPQGTLSGKEDDVIEKILTTLGLSSN